MLSSTFSCSFPYEKETLLKEILLFKSLIFLASVESCISDLISIIAKTLSADARPF